MNLNRQLVIACSLLFSSTFFTSLSAREFAGVGTKAKHVCQVGEDIVVSGTSQTITLTGACGSLQVDGVSNIVRIEQVEEISSSGMRNTIQFGSNSVGAKPVIAVSGVTTKVTADPALLVVARKTPVAASTGALAPSVQTAMQAARPIGTILACDATQTIEGVSNGQSVECAAGDRLLFSGISIETTVTGNCAAICIEGTNNVVRVDGDALAILIDGASNTLSAVRVDAVTIDGISNKVSWRTSAHKDGPKVSADGINNGVSRIR